MLVYLALLGLAAALLSADRHLLHRDLRDRARERLR